MSLPTTRMSMTLALSSRLFFRRAEAAAKESPGANCLADVTVPFGNSEVLFQDIVMQPVDARFAVGDEGEVFFDLFLQLQGKIIGFTTTLQGSYLRLRVEAVATGDQTIGVTLAYHELVVPDVGELTQEQNDEMEASLAAALADTAFPFSIEPLVAEERALAGQPELVVAGPNSSGFGDTLMLGIEVADDPGVDRVAFQGAFETDPLQGAGLGWRLDVDSELMRERVAEEIADTDFTEDADGGIPGWISTENTRVLWTGDPLNGNLYFQEPYIEEHYPEHPVWFFLEGYKKIGAGIAIDIYAAGHGDFAIDQNERSIVFAPNIYAAGYGIVPLPIPDEGSEARQVADAEVAEALLATETGFDTRRFFLGGIDEHPGLPGTPQISVPSTLDVRYEPPSQSGCKPQLAFQKSDGKAREDFLIRNVGDAPLWVCGLSFENDDEGVFSVQLPDGLALFEVEPGVEVFAVPPQGEVPIRVILDPGDHEPHTAELVLRCNDFAAPRVFIGLTGQVEKGENRGLMRVPCVEKPELIPPQEWFVDINEMIGSIGELVRPGLDVDDELELSFMGLAAEDEIAVLNGDGRWLGTADDYGDVRHVSLPVVTERGLQLGVSSKAARMELHLSIGRKTLVAEHTLDSDPQALAARGSLVAVAGKHHLALLSVAQPSRPREIAVLELGGVEGVRMTGDELVARTDDGTLEFFSLEDPHQPRHVHRMDVRGAKVHMGAHEFGIETREGTRLYRAAPSGRPRLTATLDPGAELPRSLRGRKRGAPSKGEGHMPYRPGGRVVEGAFVFEVARDGKAPTLRVFEKSPGVQVFDHKALTELLGSKRRPVRV